MKSAMDLLKNIKNKEILIEVLHLSVDYLVGNIHDEQTLRLSHKYGFQNPNDFLLVTRSISKYYSICCLDRCEMESFINWASPELCRTILAVLNVRQPEVLKHLEHFEYAKNNKLVESFFWDIRLIIGDYSFGRTISQVLKFNLVFNQAKAKNENIVFEMDKPKVEKVIAVLEKILNRGTQK